MQCSRTRESQLLEAVEKYRLLFLEEYSAGEYFLRTDEYYQATKSMIMARHWLDMHGNMVEVIIGKTKVYHGISGMTKANEMISKIHLDCGPEEAETLRQDMYQHVLVLSAQ